MKRIYRIIFLSILYLASTAGADVYSRTKKRARTEGEIKDENVRKLLGRKSCPSCDLTDLKSELRNAALQNANAHEANFSSTNLSGAQLQEANLSGAQLIDTDLSSANLEKADLSHANLSQANIHGTNFTGAHLGNATWTNGQVCSADSVGSCLWPDVQKARTKKNCPSCDLAGSNLHGITFVDANLNGANLSNTDLIGINFQGASFEGADLTNANMTGAYMPGTNFTRATLTGANLTRATLYRANFSGADLTNAVVTGATMNEAIIYKDTKILGVDLSGIRLDGAQLQWANLVGIKLNNANLEGAHLEQANLVGANLTNANLKKAILTGAHLDGATLTGADFSGAMWTDGTKCARHSIGKCNPLPKGGGYWDREYNDDDGEWYKWTEVTSSLYVGTCWPGSLLHRSDACDDWCGSDNYINTECSENKTFCKCKESITPGSKFFKKITSAAETVGSGISQAAQTAYQQTKAGAEWLAEHINDAIIQPARSKVHQIATILYKVADQLSTAGDMIRIKTAQVIGAPSKERQEHIEKYRSYIEQGLVVPANILLAKQKIVDAQHAQPLADRLGSEGVELLGQQINAIRAQLTQIQKKKDEVIKLHLSGKGIKELRELDNDLMEAFAAIEEALDALANNDCSQGVLCQLRNAFIKAIPQAQEGQQTINERIEDIDQTVNRGNIAGKSTPDRLRDSANILNQ